MSDCFVYVIAHIRNGAVSQPVKVGISGNPNARLYELQTGNPYALVIVHAFRMPSREMALHAERYFHDHAPRRMAGEWFDVDPIEAVQMLTEYLKFGIEEFTVLQGDEIEAALVKTGVRAAEELVSGGAATWH